MGKGIVIGLSIIISVGIILGLNAKDVGKYVVDTTSIVISWIGELAEVLICEIKDNFENKLYAGQNEIQSNIQPKINIALQQKIIIR